jgi:hypothetical protein
MTADENTQRDAGCARTDQVGKVFVVVGQRVRKCLVCEQFFTRRTASEHATVPCMPEIGVKTGSK